MKPDTFSPTMSAAAFSSAWMNACMQPFAAWQGWTQLMGDQWQQWIKAMGAGPNPWLPALAAGSKGQNASIEFFLPWLPRVDAAFKPFDVHGADMAVRLMMRAAWPQLSALQAAAGRPDAQTKAAPVVDNKVAQVAMIIDVTPATETPEKPAPAKRAAVRKPRTKAPAAQPAKVQKLEAVKAPAAKVAAVKPVQAKPAARRTRKPAAPKPAADQV